MTESVSCALDLPFMDISIAIIDKKGFFPVVKFFSSKP
jgi:hypothetical protein